MAAAALLQGEGAPVLGVEAAADRARVRVEADHGLVPSSSLEVVLLITMGQCGVSGHLIHAATRWDGVAELESDRATIQTSEGDVSLATENLWVDVNIRAGFQMLHSVSCTARGLTCLGVLRNAEKFGRSLGF